MVSRSQRTERRSRIVSMISSHVSPKPTIMPDFVTPSGSSALALSSSSSD